VARARHAGFVALAEAYWGREEELLGQGFDACYDKQLYDRLVAGDPAGVRARLRSPCGDRAVRFVENHDEPRAAAALGDAHRAAALCVLTTPGVALLHDGQLEGRRAHVPVVLGRRPVEAPDRALRAWYERVLTVVACGLRAGRWTLGAVEGWEDNRSCEQMAAWWWHGVVDHLVVVNLGSGPADGRVRWDAARGRDPERLVDLLDGTAYHRDLAVLAHEGLYVRLPAHGAHLIRIG
jgi:hypothetical protein